MKTKQSEELMNAMGMEELVEGGIAHNVQAAEMPEEIGDGAPEREDAFFRSQKDIDSAIGKRLRQERERWERNHAAGLLLEKAMGNLSVYEAAAALLARANGVDEGDVLELIGESTNFQDVLRFAKERNLSRQAEALGDPGFDLEAAMGDPVFRALVEAGEPLARAYDYRNMDRRIESERQTARDELISSIQRKKVRPPILHPGGAGMGNGGDILPDALIRVIDEKLKRGEKVRI